MTDEYATNGRVALDPSRMARHSRVSYSLSSASTQAVAKDLLDRGAEPPVVAVTEEQTAGRGRLDRSWSAPRYSSVLMSVGLPLPVQPSAFTLKVGVVVAEALASFGVQVQLKWPNDVVILRDGAVRKLGGILTEVHREFAVVGIGVNIDMDVDELPTPDAISLRQLGTPPPREGIIDAIVEGLVTIPHGTALEQYRERSATLGAEVTVARIAGEPVRGIAFDVDADGALLLRAHNGVEHRITVGDVQHVRPGMRP